MVRAIQVYAADAEETLPEDRYTITIGKTATTVTAESATQKADNEKVAKKALDEAAPDWAKTKLKSNKWDNKGTNADSISAIIKVAQDGGTTVTYTPDTLANYINKTAATTGK